MYLGPWDSFRELEGMSARLNRVCRKPFGRRSFEDDARAAALTAGTISASAGEALRLAARLDVTVLITAENRDEREMYAQLIHGASRRGRGPFVMVSAASLDAVSTRSGVSPGADAAGDDGAIHRFATAHSGVIFVDDIADLHASGQMRLFALLEECVASRDSSLPRTRPAIRVIAGASRHLHGERASGVFLERLFYRLNLIHVDATRSPVPKHRQRRSS